MIEVQPEQARTLAAIVDGGTFDAAARALHLTPSAVSQRVRALETAVGRPVLRRVRPVELTESGQAVLRFARQLALLARRAGRRAGARRGRSGPAGHGGGQQRLAAHLGPGRAGPGGGPGAAGGAAGGPGALARPAPHRRGDRRGHLDGHPRAGLYVRRLGVMRYRPVCSLALARAWFGDGVDAEPAVGAGALLRPEGRPAGPVPPSAEPAPPRPAAALRPGDPRVRRGGPARPGLGPAAGELQLGRPGDRGAGPLDEGRVDVALYWQQWRLSSRPCRRSPPRSWRRPGC